MRDAGAQKGPVRILCDEIGFAFDGRLERPDVLVAFVRELVLEVAARRELQVQIAKVTGSLPSKASLQVLEAAHEMLNAENIEATISRAGILHDLAHELNPDDAYPTDHTIDMLSSCASAIRFGLESPCRSRHAAEAANHIWGRVYGVTRFDSHTPSWQHEWARTKLLSAIVSLLPSPPV